MRRYAPTARSSCEAVEKPASSTAGGGVQGAARLERGRGDVRAVARLALLAAAGTGTCLRPAPPPARPARLQAPPWRGHRTYVRIVEERPDGAAARPNRRSHDRGQPAVDVEDLAVDVVGGARGEEDDGAREVFGHSPPPGGHAA